ncbi:FHA domain-containing protein, partial [Streptomyces fuscigenes]|uniref:FHA domain-containing protein n=1 Tax=Streptomyces fuscigenes TaxID=1528880 RepID=UPI001F1AC01C
AGDDWPPPQRPAPAADDDWPAPAAPSFDPVSPPHAPQQPGPAAEDDWMLPPPTGSEPFAPRPGAEQGGPQSGLPRQGVQGGPGPQQPGFAGPSRWAVVIGPDREYFMAMMNRSGPEAAGLNLPAYAPEQHMPLTGNQVTIGRRRHSTGESPDIDLSVPPEDPGVSHQHAILVQQPDGGWAVVDQNSTNGTTVNGGEEPIQPYVPIPLADGDRVHVGAWTTIRIVQG